MEAEGVLHSVGIGVRTGVEDRRNSAFSTAQTAESARSDEREVMMGGVSVCLSRKQIGTQRLIWGGDIGGRCSRHASSRGPRKGWRRSKKQVLATVRLIRSEEHTSELQSR